MLINEISESIQGELPNIGNPCLILRMSGCNLSCPYCDTKHQEVRYDFDSQELQSIIYKHSLKEILLTGGEPFLQWDQGLSDACARLSSSGHLFVIETNGETHVPNLSHVNHILVLDDKLFLPTSREKALRIEQLTHDDVIKFVYWSEDSASEAFQRLDFYYQNLQNRSTYVLSPTREMTETEEGKLINKLVLEGVILRHKTRRVKIKLQAQIHKTLGLA